MPAYGSALSPQQTTALVSFLETLHGNERPAQDASQELTDSQPMQLLGGRE
jgi:ubiquinol-cytochrome c reductase cytochrome b subunit